MEDEDNNEFIRWAHRARHLSSMLVLRDSVSVADVLLEHKIRYEYAKLKAKGNLRSRPVRYAPASQHEGAEATSTVMSSRHNLYVSSSITDTTGKKRHGSQADPERDVRNRRWRMSNLAGV